MKIKSKLLKPLFIFVSLVFVALLVLGTLATFKLSPLQAWHDSENWQEDFAYQSYSTFNEYLEEEQKFIAELYDSMAVHSHLENKYNATSEDYPGLAERMKWNASFQFRPEPQAMVGGILLVHGLTDSPYHLKAIAQTFRDKGYYVICLRLPGYGTIPGALVNVKWQRWNEAVEFAAKMVQEEISMIDNARFFVGGFSTGGALTLKYTLDAVSADSKRVPDKLFLFSPAIGVTKKAFLADWHRLVTWLPFLKKFKWESITPENDPYKFTSFPKNAGDQVHELTLVNKLKAKMLARNKAKREMMPPIYAFQSVVDGTVVTSDLVKLFKAVAPSQSELMLFDINRGYEGEVEPDKKKTLPSEELNHPAFQSKLIIATNRVEGGVTRVDDLVVFYNATRQAGNLPFTLEKMETIPEMVWPENAFALSHVCIPISPADQFYGQNSKLGKIDLNKADKLAGEKKVLANEKPGFARIRYNPFYSVVKARIETIISETEVFTIK